MADSDPRAVNQLTISTPEKKVIGRPFPPGVSGNPNGRPKKGFVLTDVMRAMLEENPDIKKALVKKLLEVALQEVDVVAIREVFDRLEGKSLQTNEVEVFNPQPILPKPNDKIHTDNSDGQA